MFKMVNFHKNSVRFNDRNAQRLNKRTLYVSPSSSSQYVNERTRVAYFNWIMLIFFLPIINLF